MADKKQPQQEAQPQSQPSHQSTIDKKTHPSKGETSGSNNPPDYPIFTKIDPPNVLAYYFESCLEDNIDPLVDPLNLLDDYVLVLPPPSPQNPKILKLFK